MSCSLWTKLNQLVRIILISYLVLEIVLIIVANITLVILNDSTYNPVESLHSSLSYVRYPSIIVIYLNLWLIFGAIKKKTHFLWLGSFIWIVLTVVALIAVITYNDYITNAAKAPEPINTIYLWLLVEPVTKALLCLAQMCLIETELEEQLEQQQQEDAELSRRFSS